MELSQKLLQSRLSVPVRYYESVESTNDLAIQWLNEGAKSGSVVIADEQRKGRGRKGRTWFTPAGVAVAMSIILRPTPEEASRTSMIGALAVVQFCESLGLSRVGIKWPNDVQVNRKKICGILPEAVWEHGKLVGVVLGMGVNVRVQFEGELQEIATSIETEFGFAINRVDAIAFMSAVVMEHVQQVDQVWSLWKNKLTTLGQNVTIEGITGMAENVDESGALMIRTADGRLHRVLAGDVILQTNQEG